MFEPQTSKLGLKTLSASLGSSIKLSTMGLLSLTISLFYRICIDIFLTQTFKVFNLALTIKMYGSISEK